MRNKPITIESDIGIVEATGFIKLKTKSKFLSCTFTLYVLLVLFIILFFIV